MRKAATEIDKTERVSDLILLQFGKVVPLDVVDSLALGRVHVRGTYAMLGIIFNHFGWRVPNPRWRSPTCLSELEDPHPLEGKD